MDIEIKNIFSRKPFNRGKTCLQIFDIYYSQNAFLNGDDVCNGR